jgi:hypothetical protein
VHSPLAVQPVTLVAPEAVDGTGTDGSLDVSITPGGTGDIPLSVSGLAAGTHQPNAADPSSPHSGSGTAGDEFTYQAEVPAGTQLARFNLDAVDDTADLDLTVYLLDGAGGMPVAAWQSATGAADENVDLVAPAAGFYQVVASVFSGTTAFDVTTFSVLAGAGDGAFTVTPSVVAGQQGVPATYTLSWAGLVPNTSYLGLVTYGGAPVTTVVSVASGDAPASGAPVNQSPPLINGTPEVGSTVTATPGEWDTEGLTFAYQWQSDAVDIPGATAADYTLSNTDGGATVTVVVTASKDGLTSTSATSAGVAVKFSAKVALSLNKRAVFSWQSVKVRVQVTSKGAPAGALGPMVTVMVGERSYDVALDKKGRGDVTVSRLARGVYTVTAEYAGTDTVAPAKSDRRTLWVMA